MTVFGLPLCQISCALLIVAASWDFDSLESEDSRFPGVLAALKAMDGQPSEDDVTTSLSSLRAAVHEEHNDCARLDELANRLANAGLYDEAIAVTLRRDQVRSGDAQTMLRLASYNIAAGHYATAKFYTHRCADVGDEHVAPSVQFLQQFLEYVLMDDKRPIGPCEPVAGYKIERPGRRGFAEFARGQSQNGASDRQATVENYAIGAVDTIEMTGARPAVFFEMIGDICGDGHADDDAKQLAACAYLISARCAATADSRHEYRKLADRAIRWQSADGTNRIQMTLDDVEVALRKCRDPMTEK